MDIHFDGEPACRPITIEDLARDNACLRAMYQFRKTVDDPLLQQPFDTVLRMASDQLCNLCYELNVDPNVLDYWQPGDDYIVTPFNPDDPD